MGLVVTGIAPGAVFRTTDASAVPPNLRLHGSFFGSDRDIGEARTAWCQARPNVTLMVAGDPTNFQGCAGFSEPFTFGDAPSSQAFSLIGKVALYLAAFFALIGAAICTVVAVRGVPAH